MYSVHDTDLLIMTGLYRRRPASYYKNQAFTITIIVLLDVTTYQHQHMQVVKAVALDYHCIQTNQLFLVWINIHIYSGSTDLVVDQQTCLLINIYSVSNQTIITEVLLTLGKTGDLKTGGGTGIGVGIIWGTTAGGQREIATKQHDIARDWDTSGHHLGTTVRDTEKLETYFLISWTCVQGQCVDRDSPYDYT